ncbi:hypothetical protein D3C86_2062150 [compost metagenome]
MEGIFVVFAPKILFTPNPEDQLLVTTPSAPALSKARANAFKFNPVLLILERQASVCLVLLLFIFSKDSGVANSCQL